jgi:hypothetical protein
MPPPILPRHPISSLPTITTPLLLPRQQQQQPPPATTSIVPALYGALDDQLPPGSVVGITLGSVAGFMLLLYLVYMCLNFGAAPERGESTVTGSVVVERQRHRHQHQHQHRRRSHGSATVEVRRTSRMPAAVIVEERFGPVGGGERIIVDEARRRSVSRSRPPPPRVVPVESETEGSEDEVVVIEEHTPPRRRQRSPRVRSVERRSRRSYGD